MKTLKQILQELIHIRRLLQTISRSQEQSNNLTVSILEKEKIEPSIFAKELIKQLIQI